MNEFHPILISKNILTCYKLLHYLSKRPDFLTGIGAKLVYWEKTEKVPRPDLLMQLASLYNVNVEEILGQPKQRNISSLPNGRMSLVLEAASKLPRGQQQKIIDMAEAYIAQYKQTHPHK